MNHFEVVGLDVSGMDSLKPVTIQLRNRETNQFIQVRIDHEALEHRGRSDELAERLRQLFIEFEAEVEPA